MLTPSGSSGETDPTLDCLGACSVFIIKLFPLCFFIDGFSSKQRHVLELGVKRHWQTCYCLKHKIKIHRLLHVLVPFVNHEDANRLFDTGLSTKLRGKVLGNGEPCRFLVLKSSINAPFCFLHPLHLHQDSSPQVPRLRRHVFTP